MSKYLIEASYGPEGVKGLTKDGAAKRRAVVESAVAGLGGRVEAMYYAFGDVDAYIIADMPDAAAVTALALAVNRSGSASVRTRVLLTVEDVDAAIAKSVKYSAPGT